MHHLFQKIETKLKKDGEEVIFFFFESVQIIKTKSKYCNQKNFMQSKLNISLNRMVIQKNFKNSSKLKSILFNFFTIKKYNQNNQTKMISKK
jgi:hypothetical protein